MSLIEDALLTDAASSLYEDKAQILQLPMPPTSNHQYSLFRRGRKTYHVPSPKLKSFQEAMKQWLFSRPPNFLVEKHKVQTWIKEGYVLEIGCLFCFKKKNLFTKQDVPKRLDVSNRLKALHDSLCHILEIDDSIFFRVYAEKAIAEDNLDEMVFVDIFPIR